MEFVDKIVIKVALNERQLELTKDELVRFCYRIWDGRTGNQMFFAQESDKIFNGAENWGSNREFVMPFVDAMGNEGFKLNKTRSLNAHMCCSCCDIDSCCKSLCTTCCDYDNDWAELRGFNPKPIINYIRYIIYQST